MNSFMRKEMNAGYCPFGGGEPKCNSGRLTNNRLYRIDINVNPKNPLRQGAYWTFKIQT